MEQTKTTVPKWEQPRKSNEAVMKKLYHGCKLIGIVPNKGFASLKFGK